MPSDIAQINLTGHGMNVRTMAGTMAEYSTRRLHAHSHHQVLRIRSGVAMLVDRHRRQPMFGALTAFIPAGFAHRSIVMGNPAAYKSLYLARDLLSFPEDEIRLFFITPLGSALFDRIQIFTGSDFSRNYNKECLDLFLKLLPEQMKNTAALVRLPEPDGPPGRKGHPVYRRKLCRAFVLKGFYQGNTLFRTASFPAVQAGDEYHHVRISAAVQNFDGLICAVRTGQAGYPNRTGERLRVTFFFLSGLSNGLRGCSQTVSLDIFQRCR